MAEGTGGKKILFFAAVLFAVYFLSGIYSLIDGQQALVLRFGKVVSEVISPGVHYHLPFPFEKVRKVNVSEVQKASLKSILGNNMELMTGDENLILVDAVISYDIKNLSYYLLNSQDPAEIIVSAGQMFLNYELGRMMVDDVLTVGKSILMQTMKEEIQKVMDNLKTGIHLISIELINISPPSYVSSAFKDVSDAREKKQEIIRDAEGYSNSVIPVARGKADSEVIQAQAYAEEIITRAKSSAVAYELVLREYEKNPEITKNIRYLETIKKILSRVQVNLDAGPENSLYYADGSKVTATE